MVLIAHSCFSFPLFRPFLPVQRSLSSIRSSLPWLPCPASAVSTASRVRSRRTRSTSDCSKRRSTGRSLPAHRGLHRRRQFSFPLFFNSPSLLLFPSFPLFHKPKREPPHRPSDQPITNSDPLSRSDRRNHSRPFSLALRFSLSLPSLLSLHPPAFALYSSPLSLFSPFSVRCSRAPSPRRPSATNHAAPSRIPLSLSLSALHFFVRRA